jgi:hypothetical protein
MKGNVAGPLNFMSKKDMVSYQVFSLFATRLHKAFSPQVWEGFAAENCLIFPETAANKKRHDHKPM